MIKFLKKLFSKKKKPDIDVVTSLINPESSLSFGLHLEFAVEVIDEQIHVLVKNLALSSADTKAAAYIQASPDIILKQTIVTLCAATSQYVVGANSPLVKANLLNPSVHIDRKDIN